ncbi:MAG: DNA/RNA non-specific endonuclease [Saprospiraceae bacterium]|nr:DNA/RNA non-specific endonuclease [Saprospiraceae bacterium]
MQTRLLLFFFFISASTSAQSLEHQKNNIQSSLADLERQRAALSKQLESVQLQLIQRDLRTSGLPSDTYIMHSAMALEYAEDHEQARWVAHIILPDIVQGVVTRSNDFRPDTLVATGSAVEADYFLKSPTQNGVWTFDGFGYDRGHLAPSADFRWSATALSESYYYSNMSPQQAEFNRGRWSELETLLRNYVIAHPGVQLFVVTGPVLEPDLPVIERGVNRVSIPRYFFKVALDPINHRSIGFIMPNTAIQYPVESFALPVDSVEQRTGLYFFRSLPDSSIEAHVDKAAWLPEVAGGDVPPLAQPDLPRNHFNTVVAARYMGSGEQVAVCGTVVGTRYSKTGNLWVNLDKQFPNQVFSVFIRKQDLPNFSEDPQREWTNRQVCFKGKIENMNGVPTMNIEREENVYLYER